MSAYAFARLRFRGREQLFVLFLGTLMVPQEVLIVPMYWLMQTLGWVDSYWALILPWAFTAFGTFLLRQFFLTVPAELEEAARVDGCGPFGIVPADHAAAGAAGDRRPGRLHLHQLLGQLPVAA